MTPDPDGLPARLAALAALDAWSEAPMRAAMTGLERADGMTAYPLRIPNAQWRAILACAEQDNVSVQSVVLDALATGLASRVPASGD